MKYKSTDMHWDNIFEIEPSRLTYVLQELKKDNSVVWFSTTPIKNIYSDVIRIKIWIRYNAHIKSIEEQKLSKKNLLQKSTLCSIHVLLRR